MMDIQLPVITKVKIVLTEKCQLNCKYCYESHGYKSISLELAKKIIDMVHENASKINRMPDIGFFGGEPLLVYEELMKPCIDYIRDTLKSRCNISFTTNGLLLDEEKLKYLKANNVKFMLSIDGCKEAHDINRVHSDGSGSFEELEKNIPLILKYFPSTMARMTLTPENLPYLYESVKYIKDKGFIDMHIIPNLHVSTGRDWTDKDFELAREQLLRVKEYIINSFEEDELPLIFRTLADMFPRAVLASYCERVGHHRTASCCSPDKRCGIGVLNNVTADIHGNFFSCQHGSPKPDESNVLYLGNIEEGINEDRRIALLEMNRKSLTSDSMKCEECQLNSICTGGCVPNNYAVTGDFTVIPAAYCKWTNLLYDTAVDIIEYFDEEQSNELFKDYFYGVVKRGVICVC